MSRDMPLGWEVSKLRDLATHVTDKWEPGDGRYRYLGLEHLAQGTGKILEVGSSEGLASLKSKFLQGDVLFGKLRPNLRKTALPDFDGIASTDIIVLRAKRSVDPRFLLYTASSDPCINHAVRSAAGTKMPRTSWALLGDYEVALPPLVEQRCIAEILSSADEAIQATQAVIDQTVKIEQGVLQHLLTRGDGETKYIETEIGRIPSAWQLQSIAEICTLSNGNGFRPPDWSNTGLPIIRIQNLNGSAKFNYFAGTPKPKWIVNPGDLLFSWAGVKGVSFGPHLWGGPQGVLNQHIFKVTPKKDIDGQWLYHVMRFVTARIEAKAHGFKDTLLHVHKGDILNQLVAVPPPSEQAQIVERLSAFSQAIIDAKKQLAALIQIKDALMAELLTGRRRVSASLPLAAE